MLHSDKWLGYNNYSNNFTYFKNTMKKFNLIAAVSLNGIIGDSQTNSIPWYLPHDLKYFKSVTDSKTIVMGSNTFRSIGKPLPSRRNVVISRSRDIYNNYDIDDLYYSFSDALKYEKENFFVIGGQHIYEDALHSNPSSLYITIVKLDCSGDVRFPIAGSRFLHDTVYTTTGAKYVCSKRSSWMNENSVDFQFTVFELTQ